jgi:hypothetical protein
VVVGDFDHDDHLAPAILNYPNNQPPLLVQPHGVLAASLSLQFFESQRPHRHEIEFACGGHDRSCHLPKVPSEFIPELRQPEVRLLMEPTQTTIFEVNQHDGSSSFG